MDFKNIIELIEKEQLNLRQTLNQDDTEIKFFDQIISNNNLTSFHGLLTFNKEDILKGLLCAHPNNLGYQKINECINKNKLMTAGNFNAIAIPIMKLLDIEKDSSIPKFFKINPLNEITELIIKQKIKHFDLDTFKILYDTYDEYLLQIITLIDCIEDLRRDYDYGLEEYDELKTNELKGIRISSKRKEEMLKESLSIKYDIEEIYKDLSTINNYYQKIRTQNKEKLRNSRKTLTNYTTLIQKLKNFTKKDLLNKTTINSILDLIPSEEIAKEFLRELNIEQQKYFEELNKEYKNLSQNKKIIVQALLKKYEIEFNNLSNSLKTKLLNLEETELELFLEKIKELKITSPNLIYFILENSTYEIVNNLINLVKDGILTFEFLFQNKEVFSNSNELNNYNSLIEKINLFKDEGINTRIFINDLNIYLTNYQKLEYNLNILKQYKLLYGLNKLTEFKLLTDEDLDTKIDLFLELGYEKILEENVELLNNKLITIKKLYILKNMGLLPTDINNLNEIMKNKNFLSYINDNDIDNYIFNVVDFRIDNNLINDKTFNLDKYFDYDDSSRVIEVGGVFLSRNRIKRNLLKLEEVSLTNQDKMLYSYLYGTILNEEEYNNIINNFNNINKNLTK